MLVDKEFYNMYRSAFNTLGSLLIKTQTKIAPVVQFMLQKNKKNPEESLFENLIQEDFEFGFLVETNFRSSLLTEYYNSKNSAAENDVNEDLADSAEKKRQRFQKFAHKIAEDSLFTNSYNFGTSIKGATESSTTVGNSSFELSHIQLVRP